MSPYAYHFIIILLVLLLLYYYSYYFLPLLLFMIVIDMMIAGYFGQCLDCCLLRMTAFLALQAPPAAFASSVCKSSTVHA